MSTRKIIVTGSVALAAACLAVHLFAPVQRLTCAEIRTGDQLVNEQSGASAVAVDLNAETVSLEYLRNEGTRRYTCERFAALDGWNKAERE